MNLCGLNNSFKSWKFTEVKHIMLYCINQNSLHIAFNLIFHEQTKHIGIDCHFVRKRLRSKELSIESINSSYQLTNILTKFLRGPRIQYRCSKFGAYNLYGPA